MKVTIEVDSLEKIGYSHQVRVPNPDIHMLCLAKELSVLGIGTLPGGKAKVGNGTPAKHNLNQVQVAGLKAINVTDNSVELVGSDNTILIVEKVSKDLPKSTEKATPSDKVSGNDDSDKFGKATARPNKRAKKSDDSSK